MTGTIPPTDGHTESAAALRRRRRRPECRAAQDLAPAPVRPAGVQAEADAGRGAGKPVCGPDTLRITGGRALGGRVTVSGSVTATQFLLSAAAALPHPIQLKGAPQGPEINSSLALLARCGWMVEQRDSRISIAPIPSRSGDGLNPGECPADTPSLFDSGLMDIPDHLVPALLRTQGMAVVPRPLEGSADVHELALVYKAFGDDFRTTEHGYAVVARSRPSAQVEVALLYPSRPATLSALLRAASTGTELMLDHPDTSPETQAVWDALMATGYTGTLSAQKLHLNAQTRGARTELWLVPGDRIEAMIYVSAIAASGGTGSVAGAPLRNLRQVRHLIERVGVGTHTDADRHLNIHPPHEPGTKAWDGIRVQAGSEPGDLDPAFTPLLTALALTRPGRHRLAERTAPHDLRLLLAQLEQLGAQYMLGATGAVSFDGPQALRGAQLVAPDERCAAAVLISALTAEGTTIVDGADRLLLRHPRLIANLSDLGAEIEVVP